MIVVIVVDRIRPDASSERLGCRQKRDGRGGGRAVDFIFCPVPGVRRSGPVSRERTIRRAASNRGCGDLSYDGFGFPSSGEIGASAKADDVPRARATTSRFDDRGRNDASEDRRDERRTPSPVFGRTPSPVFASAPRLEKNVPRIVLRGEKTTVVLFLVSRCI